MKRNCGTAHEWLGAFADGELDPARAEEVRRHLEACADCRRELDQIMELNRLAKSVEHPQLAEDYWDWHRTRVWHGIRNVARSRMPAFRPSFAWPRLATLAAGAVVVLLVVFAGWRTLFLREGPIRPVGEVGAERERAAEQPIAAAPNSGSPAASREAGKVAGGARTGVEGRPEALAQAPVEEVRRVDKTKVGYAARSTGATGATAVSRPTTAPAPAVVPKAEVAAAAPREESPAMRSAGAPRARASAEKQKGRIVSGPVLLDAPPIADADVTDTGTVLLSVRTDSAGRVLSAAVSRSSGSPRLDSAAVHQMRKSHFKAAVRNNRTVPSSFKYPVRFQKKQSPAQEQQKPVEKQREEHGPQQQQNQSTQDDKSHKPDSSNKDTPLKEKTSK